MRSALYAPIRDNTRTNPRPYSGAVGARASGRMRCAGAMIDPNTSPTRSLRTPVSALIRRWFQSSASKATTCFCFEIYR